ncbi:protein tyrosine/serine phosphatase [Polaribacter sp. Hel1_85]|nr:protein tyrosine/serine phosphatase [Polaribacter sp. Hel1_85]
MLYRSEQPSKKGFKELELMGVKTILNLRRLKNNKKKAKNFNFNLVHIPLKTKELNEKDILNILHVIKDSKQPVLVHCWHGSDRTGSIIAAYRMVIENWSKEKAIKEFQKKNLGYHYKMYPNLLVLLENLDIQKLKKQLN